MWHAHDTGDANSHATQALKNIRTVRAFSMELKEIAKYENATGEALKKGVKDSFAGALSSALTSYIDLSISVLVSRLCVCRQVLL